MSRHARGFPREPCAPGWRTWQSGGGHWWATRTGPDAQWRDGSGIPMTEDAETEAGLLAKLAAYAEAAAP